MTFGISFLAISEPFHAGYILAGIDRWYAFLSDARAILRWIYPSWYFVSFSCRYFFRLGYISVVSVVFRCFYLSNLRLDY